MYEAIYTFMGLNLYFIIYKFIPFTIKSKHHYYSSKKVTYFKYIYFILCIVQIY